MNEKPPKVREIMPDAASMADIDFDMAEREYALLIEQRTRLNEKARFGILTLNSAGLVGLLSALGQPELVETAFGARVNLLASAVFFLLGIVAGAVSIWAEAVESNYRIADQLPRRSTAQITKALYDGPYNERQDALLREQLTKEITSSPLYRRSRWAEWSMSASIGLWLGGMSLPLMGLVKAIWRAYS